MFGKRKKPDTKQQWSEPKATSPAGEEDSPRPEGDPQAAAPAKPARPNKPAAKPDTSAVLNRTPARGESARRSDSGRRAGSSAPHTPSRGDNEEARRLIVGKEIALSGQIRHCDKLLVEGTIEAELSESTNLEVAACGSYSGTAVIDTADIAGRFDGDLTVRERLYVRATGQVHGTIRYRALEIEGGGRIGGTLVELGDDDIAALRRGEDAPATAPTAESARPAPAAWPNTAGEASGTNAAAKGGESGDTLLHERGAASSRDTA